MAARFVAEDGILKGLVLPLDQGGELIIGRDPDECQVLLEDPAASRRHLLCKNTIEGLTIENLSLTNPVQVNDEELVGSRLLKEGDLVRIGSGVYRFLTDPNLNPLAQEQIHADETPKLKNALPEEEFQPSEEESANDSILEDQETARQMQFPEINFDVPDIGRWLLKVISGPNHGAEFSMQDEHQYTIGTDPNTCDIVFHDTSVSRQHATISIDGEDALFIEDLKSRNGTHVDGVLIKEKMALTPHTVVTMGTTSFVVYDREGNMQTIISPLLPSIVKVLQREDSTTDQSVGSEEAPQNIEEPAVPPKERSIGGLILLSIITGLFVLAAIGTTTLFKSEPVAQQQAIDIDKIIGDITKEYPSIKYSFNKGTGKLVLFGHLLTAQDKTQLTYNLQGLPFIKSIDDTGVIIDEYVWQEINLVLNKNPAWRSITVQSPEAGQFVLIGTLQSRKQADQLFDYISTNFPYLDRLEKRVVVEEDILGEVTNRLENAGIVNAQAAYHNGVLTLTGGIAAAKQEAYNTLLEEFKKLPGVTNVRSLVNEIAPEQAMINISDRYEVSGFSRIGNSISVVVNGRIITKSDILDGMTITEIAPGSVFLEKDGVKYRIDY